MSFSFFTLMGFGVVAAPGAVNSITIPISVPFPGPSSTDGVYALIRVLALSSGTYDGNPSCQRSAALFTTVTDDAIAAPPYGNRWSPYQNGTTAIGGTTIDPPQLGSPNVWTWGPRAFYEFQDSGLIFGGSPPDTTISNDNFSHFLLLGIIFASPKNITITFEGDSHSTIPGVPWVLDRCYAEVWGFDGVSCDPYDDKTTDVPGTLPGGPCGISYAADELHQWVSPTSRAGPGGCGAGLALALTESETTAGGYVSGPGLILDASSLISESTLSGSGVETDCAFCYADYAGGTGGSEVNWVHGIGQVNFSGLTYGPFVTEPDPLTITLTTSFTDVGPLRHWVVTLVDSAGIPSNTTNHLVTPYWRLANAPNPVYVGFDGTWTSGATDLTSTGLYVVQNPIDSGYYIPVPKGAAYTLHGFLYDGLISNEVTVILPGQGVPPSIGAPPYLHAHYGSAS